jgi:membrane-bound metal-dependent hydrolase YbcI (DUF457 family)
MPSTVVHVGFGLLIATGLVTDSPDRRLVALLAVVLVAPELDTAAGLLLPGAHRALLHTLLLPALAAAAVYYDTRVRPPEASWLRRRAGPRGVRLAWVLLAVHLFAHLLLDYAHLEGINAFYPLHDSFYRLEGELYVSNVEGVVQTFVDVSPGGGGGLEVDAGATGTTEDTTVANPVEPDGDPEAGGSGGDDEPVDRRFPIAVQGWQLYLVATGLFAAAARRLQRPLDG